MTRYFVYSIRFRSKRQLIKIKVYKIFVTDFLVRHENPKLKSQVIFQIITRELLDLVNNTELITRDNFIK